MATPVLRLETHFTGRVQGVGFRYTARQIAQGFEVTGEARNLPDGRVRLVAEGAAAEARAFVEEVRRQLAHYIKEAETRELAGPAEFRDFHIA